MSRKRQPLTRPSAIRNARLIITDTEDTEATVRYFKGFVSTDYYQDSRVHIELLVRDDTRSAPERILELLEKYKRTYQIAEDDELWLVIDVDQWGEKKLSVIVQDAVQKGICLAVSNPAIEIWFLLHLTYPDKFDAEAQKALLNNQRISKNRTALEVEIVKIAGSYSKGNLNVHDFYPMFMKQLNEPKNLIQI